MMFNQQKISIQCVWIKNLVVTAFDCDCAGFDISTSPLAPASEFLKKGLSGKYILVFTCRKLKS